MGGFVLCYENRRKNQYHVVGTACVPCRARRFWVLPKLPPPPFGSVCNNRFCFSSRFCGSHNRVTAQPSVLASSATDGARYSVPPSARKATVFAPIADSVAGGYGIRPYRIKTMKRRVGAHSIVKSMIVYTLCKVIVYTFTVLRFYD